MSLTAAAAPMAGAALVAPASLHDPAALLTPLAVKLRNIVGSYTGSVIVTGIHTQPVTVTISSQTRAGRFTGLLTSVNDPGVTVAISGKVLPHNKIRMTFSGGANHGPGVIQGTGTGTIAVHGTHITLRLHFVFTKPFHRTGSVILTS